jgi:lysophospholipase L1-like esterase
MRRLGGPVLLVASVLLTLGLLEAAARALCDPTGGYADILAQAAEARRNSIHIQSDDPELVYVTRPNVSADNGTRMSEVHGILSTRDVPATRRSGTFRIAVLGDSITAAHPLRVRGVPSFSEHLEARLREQGIPGEVLNFGTDGYGTLQEARLLETRVGLFAPDLVLAAFCFNDPSNSYTPTVWFLDDAAPRSYLFDFVARRLGLVPSMLSPDHPRYTHAAIDWEPLYRSDGRAWRGVEEGFARMARWGKTRGVPVVLAVFPLLAGDDTPAERTWGPRLLGQVQAAARENGLPVLDLTAAFAGRRAEDLRLRPGDPIHPNALGHRLAGDAIAAALPRPGTPAHPR